MKKIRLAIIIIFVMIVPICVKAEYPTVIPAKKKFISEVFRLKHSYKYIGLTHEQEYCGAPLRVKLGPFDCKNTGGATYGMLQPNGRIGWKYWFEPVDESTESSKALVVTLQKKVDKGPWTKVLSTFAPRNKPTIYKEFTDEFLPRKITKKEFETEMKLYDDSVKNRPTYDSNFDAICRLREESRISSPPRSRNVYRFIIENKNDYDVYLFKKDLPEIKGKSGKKIYSVDLTPKK